MVNHLPVRYRYAVEGRHPSWFSDESYRFMSERNLCLAWSEVEGVANPAPVTADFVYLRLIGDRSIPDSEFGKIRRDGTELIQRWADKIESIKDKVAFAIAMANNHLEGFAPITANKLRVLLGLQYVTWKDARQRSLSDFTMS